MKRIMNLTLKWILPALFLSSCQSPEPESPVIYPAAFDIQSTPCPALLAHWPEAEVEALQTAAREAGNLHPYLRDYLLGIVPVCIAPVLIEALQAWEVDACKNGAPDKTCMAIRQLVAELQQVANIEGERLRASSIRT